ncbi:hypothetical protein A2U01_0079336, partial [Trifolium medium]|nr:hypothetical protein [Trifolium medium]
LVSALRWERRLAIRPQFDIHQVPRITSLLVNSASTASKLLVPARY